jgi:hypothetical protein
VFCAVDKSVAGKGGLYYSDCHVTAANPAALDATQALALWNATEAKYNKVCTDDMCVEIMMII